jgi:hypothetical protein
MSPSESSEIVDHVAEHAAVLEFRRAETPSDLHAACGTGVGVLLGIVAWAAIITVSVAALT